jgi:hypothetical protein
MYERTKKNLVTSLKADNSKLLVQSLDEFKGSYAVEHMLKILLSTRNKHTLQSALKLIRKGHRL